MAGTGLYRISQIDTFTSSSVVTTLGDRYHIITGSSGHNLSRVVAVMTAYGSTTSGSVTLLDGGTLKLETLIPGEVYGVYPTSIQVSAGTAFTLS
jgi:hypothetical protein